MAAKSGSVWARRLFYVVVEIEIQMKRDVVWGAIGRGPAALWMLAGALVLCATVLGERAVAAEPKHDFEVVDRAQLYYGKKKHPKTPAVCVADSVWAEIPEYKKILEEELDADDPRYHLLLKRATKRFQRALKKLAGRDGYDVIGEVGAIKAVGKKKKKIPTVTQGLIELVTRD
ncbi:MAG: hypothetical protein AAGD14_14745 [Planctomycetota bacterium]